ncbi:MAG: protein kinase [Candidatus Eisenbacteria bacterium]|nr:protein kinase [Candidatus Eisenbacteria bacterium]
MATSRKKGPPEEIIRFAPGDRLAGKYEVVGSLGSGWEGQVYLVKELATGIERAAKFFLPRRNPGNRTLVYHAKKLHRLRHCPIVIQYHTQETLVRDGYSLTFLVSEFVEGELLSEFLKRQPGRRLQAFEALHLLHCLATGIECIHRMRDYHGDLHVDNIIINRRGLGFDVKLVDVYQWDPPKHENIQEDVFDLIRVFYDALGGRRHYAKQPQEVRDICCGLKRTLIARKFRTAGQLRERLERIRWETR